MSIEGEIVIGRPEQLTDGPIGKGTRFLASTRSM